MKLELTLEELAALVHACSIADDEGYITPGDTMHRIWRRLVELGEEKEAEAWCRERGWTIDPSNTFYHPYTDSFHSAGDWSTLKRELTEVRAGDDTDPDDWLIRSADGLFWNNADGWAGIAQATRFLSIEKSTFRLPMGGEWFRLED